MKKPKAGGRCKEVTYGWKNLRLMVGVEKSCMDAKNKG